MVGQSESNTIALTISIVSSPYSLSSYKKSLRIAATKYLDELVRIGLLSKHKKWKNNYYMNDALMHLLINESSEAGSPHI